MKNYKDYNKYLLGGSDIATLTIISNMQTITQIAMGEDASYKGYLVDKDVKIGDHYQLVNELDATPYLAICDDDSIVLSIRFNTFQKVKIYQSGLTLIIKVEDLNEATVESGLTI